MNMNMTFDYIQTDQDLLTHNLITTETVTDCRGFCNSKDKIILNLSATQWKSSLDIGEDYTILKINDTLSHEYFHLLIGLSQIDASSFTNDGEERVCKILSGQL